MKVYRVQKERKEARKRDRKDNYLRKKIPQNENAFITVVKGREIKFTQQLFRGKILSELADWPFQLPLVKVECQN